MKLHIDIVEDGKLVRYKRLGECKQCGACCRKKITFQWTISKAGKQDTDATPDDWSNWEGYSVIYARGGLLVHPRGRDQGSGGTLLQFRRQLVLNTR